MTFSQAGLSRSALDPQSREDRLKPVESRLGSPLNHQLKLVANPSHINIESM
jgi:hypothetical protein